MKRFLSFAALLGAATLASAHTGHGTHSLFEGLSHPLGADHLLAMVAVGLWSALALRGSQRWQAPATFLAAMTAGAAAGAAGLSLPGTESGIALSVSVFGVMLLAGQRLAHGAELPLGASFGAYAAGFLATTALLHAAGLGLGGLLGAARQTVWRVAGAGLGVAGLLLLARV
jgi:urease accessory protein